MASLWSMIEVLQVIVFVSLFENLKIPVNAQTMNKSLIQVFTYDIINTQQWFDP